MIRQAKTGATRLLRDAAVMERKLRKATKELLVAEKGRFWFWLWLRKRHRNWAKNTEPQQPAASVQVLPFWLG